MTEYYNPGSAFNGRSSLLGRRAHPITGILTGHAGDDGRTLAEIPIPAAADGKVILKRYNYNGRTGYGNYIVLEHFDNNTKQIVHTLYAHMIRESPLTVGAVISKRDTVGNVRSTGVAQETTYTLKLERDEQQVMHCQVHLLILIPMTSQAK